ncbi:hypothetical protein M3Y97_00627900 [Aphelenchoides bicaudatus]|nr:hypothetical protein M3Y97_00627900 [Aphelenchoides bicaudatus]
MLRLIAVSTLLLFAHFHTAYSVTDVDGKPLVDELANKLKDCDPEGPKMPDNPDPPANQDEDNKQPEGGGDGDKQPEQPEGGDKQPEGGDGDKQPEQPKGGDGDKQPEQPKGDCKDNYPECKKEQKLCMHKTYAKMMKVECKETCGECP